MKNRLYFIIILSALFFSCKKNNTNDINSGGDQSLNAQFTVSVADREDNYAVLNWTRVKDSTVTYTVKLNGTVLSSNLKDSSYTVNNLVNNQSYQGQIIATNNKGATTTVNFYIDKNVGFIYTNYRAGYSNNYFGCFTLSGKQIWGTLLAGISYSSVISNDTIFVETSANGGANSLYALSTKDGSIFWSKQAYPVSQPSIMYYKGILYTTSSNGVYTIAALDASTGLQLWQVPATGQMTLGDGLLLMMSTTLDAYDYKTGIKKWSFNNTSSKLVGALCESNSTVYTIGYDPTVPVGLTPISKLYAIDCKTGLQKWTFSFPGTNGVDGIGSRPVVVGNTVYFSVGADEYAVPQYDLFAVNTQNGALAWATGPNGNGHLSADSTGAILNVSDHLIKSDLKTGGIIWKTANPSSYYNYVITQDKIYSRSGLPLIPDYASQAPFYLFSTITGAPVTNALSSFPYTVNGDFIISINGKTYYSVKSAMYGVNY